MRISPVYVAIVLLILLSTTVCIMQSRDITPTQVVISDLEDEYTIEEPLRDNYLGSDNSEMIWNRTYDSDGITNPYRILEADSGGYFIYYYYEKISISSASLMRIDYSGNQIWNRTIHETISNAQNNMIETQDNGFTLICTFYNITSGNNSVFITHLDSEGGQLWNSTVHLDWQDSPWALIEATSGGYFLLGYHQDDDIGAYPESLLIRTDEYGMYLWSKTYAPNSLYADGIDLIESATGDIVLLSRTENVAFGLDTWLLCVDANGNHLWNKTYDLALYDGPVDIERSSIGGYLILSTIESPSRENISLLYLDEYGEIEKNLTYEISGDEQARDLVISADGSPAFVGFTRPVAGFDAIWFVKLNQSGSITWNEILGDDAHYQPKSLLEIAPEAYIIGGATAEYHSETTPYDIWIAEIAEPMSGLVSENQVHELGTWFSYDLDVESALGIDRWQVNDTTNFMVDNDGLIQNASALSLGTYGLEVIVYDTADRYLTTTFSVTVIDTQPPSWKMVPTNRFAEYGVEFEYDIDATDPSGISQWWLNDTTFTINSTGLIRNATILTIGDYSLCIYVNDTFGHTTSADIMILVRDTTNPQPVDLADIDYEAGTTGIWLTWSCVELLPASFQLFLDDDVILSDDWDGSNIMYYVENLNLGAHNITVVFEDTSGNYASDTVLVNVIDTTLPSVNAPLDIWYIEGTSGNVIEWYPTDLYPYSYTIYQDNVQIRTGGWTNSVVSLPVDNLEAGEYIFRIVFFDTSGNFVSDSVTVTVQASTTNTVTITTQTNIQEIIRDLSGQIGALTIGFVIMTIVSTVAIILVIYSIKKTPG